MVIRQQFIESLFCTIITELELNYENNDNKNKLYQNLCSAINSEGFNIPFNNITDYKNFESFISEYNNCFEKLQQKQSQQNGNEFEDKFSMIREIAKGGYGVVYEVKSKIDQNNYAIKKSIPKGNKKVFYSLKLVNNVLFLYFS
jgi:hypothetical protein